MKKKTLVTLVSIVAVCALLFGLSKWINWPVDNDQASGNIAKTTRYSKKVVEEASSNMQELLLNDDNFKNSIVLAYTVMQTRAKQFNTLVDLSNEVAKDLPPFADLLADMQAAKPLIENVCAQMKDAEDDLNATLEGESRSALAQNTNNAALAYGALQKQNSLAERFVETTDAWLAQNEGSDQLKLVRDQWLDYLHVTAVLSQDKEAAKWNNTTATLTAEQASAALNEFPTEKIQSIYLGSIVSCFFMGDNPALPLPNEIHIDPTRFSVDQEVNTAINPDNIAMATVGDGDVLKSFEGMQGPQPVDVLAGDDPFVQLQNEQVLFNAFPQTEMIKVLQEVNVTNVVQNVGPAIEAMEANVNIAKFNPTVR